MRMRSFQPVSLLLAVVCAVLGGEAGAESDLFSAFTTRIEHQVRSDKQDFSDANTCVEWFYRERLRKPQSPPTHGISFPLSDMLPSPPKDGAQCRTRYPEGLDAARKDFTLSQSLLSVSLTFYEFALVADRNDDGRYSHEEVQDMLESFGLSFNEALPPAAHLAVLNAQFDSIHRSTGLDKLMAGMGVLYERGYRLSPQDRASLNQVLG